MTPATPARGVLLALALAGAVQAQPAPQESQKGPEQQTPPPESVSAAPTPQTWALHGQFTDIFQYYPAFRSPYEGPQSFERREHTGETIDVTLYGGVRPWAGGEIWINPELYQGFAPNNTLGIAGFVNGDGAKVGKTHPYTRVARLFLRQTVALSGDAEGVSPDLNQLGGAAAKDRLVVTVGKLNATDVFDTNKYAHDPRHDFINWSMIDAGSFDYAADAWGYSYGGAVELYRGAWSVRGGLFDMSIVPNNKTLTPDLSQVQAMGEVERRIALAGRPGAVRLIGFVSRANMGLYTDATALAAATHATPDTALVRRYRSRPGVALNLEQEVANGVGVFGRLGWTDGAYESYEYTDIDRTVQAGVSVEGARWGRKDDSFGAAVVLNAVSREAQSYFAAGGLGILIGDGRLPHPGAEQIVEAYYSLALAPVVRVSLDEQLIVHPAYNRDRGPVDVVGVRVHLQR